MNASGTNPLPANFTALSLIASHIPQPREPARIPAGRRAPGARADLWVEGPSRGGALSGAGRVRPGRSTLAALGRGAGLGLGGSGSSRPPLGGPAPRRRLCGACRRRRGAKNPHRDRHQHRRRLRLSGKRMAVSPNDQGLGGDVLGGKVVQGRAMKSGVRGLITTARAALGFPLEKRGSTQKAPRE